MSLTSRSIFNPDDLSVLESQGTAQRLNSTVRLRKWLIHFTRLTATLSSDDEDNVWCTLPISLHSRETYEYVGLNPTKSAMLWDSWNNLEPQFKPLDDCSDGGWVPERSILWYTMQHIHHRADKHDPATTLDDWHNTMRRWGVKEDLIERIMDPRFKQVRLTGTAGSHVLETMKDSYKLLQVVRMVSEQRSKQRKAGRGDGQVARRYASTCIPEVMESPSSSMRMIVVVVTAVPSLCYLLFYTCSCFPRAQSSTLHYSSSTGSSTTSSHSTYCRIRCSEPRCNHPKAIDHMSIL